MIIFHAFSFRFTAFAHTHTLALSETFTIMLPWGLLSLPLPPPAEQKPTQPPPTHPQEAEEEQQQPHVRCLREQRRRPRHQHCLPLILSIFARPAPRPLAFFGCWQRRQHHSKTSVAHCGLPSKPRG